MNVFTNACKRCLIFALFLLLVGCGSAAEFSDSADSQPHEEFSSPQERIALAEYQVSFDPADVSLTFTPSAIGGDKVLDRLTPFGSTSMHDSQYLSTVAVSPVVVGSGCGSSTF